MANVSYPQYNLTTFTLPISLNDSLSVEEYKNKYGIDLRDFIALDTDNHNILIDQGKGNILLRIVDYNVISNNYDCPFGPIVDTANTQGDAGNSPATFSLFTTNSDSANWAFKLQLSFNSDDEFIIDNLQIMFYEI